MEKSEEEKLRELIRKELDNRAKLHETKFDEKKLRGEVTGMSVERQRIIDEEIRNFYMKKGNYQPYVNEEGDTEWLTEAELKEREMQIPVDMEELEVGQKKIRNRAIVIVVLFFLALVLILFSMREKTGSIQVICSIPDATIVLDGVPTEMVTDFTLKGISPGPHLISVMKTGYYLEGEVNRRINLRAGTNEIVTFTMKPKADSSLGR